MQRPTARPLALRGRKRSPLYNTHVRPRRHVANGITAVRSGHSRLGQLFCTRGVSDLRGRPVSWSIMTRTASVCQTDRTIGRRSSAKAGRGVPTKTISGEVVGSAAASNSDVAGPTAAAVCAALRMALAVLITDLTSEASVRQRRSLHINLPITVFKQGGGRRPGLRPRAAASSCRDAREMHDGRVAVKGRCGRGRQAVISPRMADLSGGVGPLIGAAPPPTKQALLVATILRAAVVKQGRRERTAGGALDGRGPAASITLMSKGVR